MKNFVGLALIAFGLGSISSPAVAGPYSPAYDAAFEATLADPGDLDALFAFAELAVREGDYEGAISCLERLLLLDQDGPGVRVELGGLYLRIGAHEQARFYANSALQTPTLDADTRGRAEALLALADTGASRHRVRGSVAANFGYQSNANSAPADASVIVAGADYDLTDDERARPDGNGFVSAALGYTYDPKLVGGLTVDGALAGSYSKQIEVTDYDIGSVGAALGPRLRLGRVEDGSSVWVHGLANVSVLAGELYGVGLGGGLTLSWSLSRGLWLDAVAEVTHLTYHDGDVAPSASDQTGLAPRGALQLRYRVADHVWVLLGGHGATVRAAEATEASTSFGGLAGLTVPFGLPLWATSRPWAFDLVYNLTLQRYDEADPDVDPDTTRAEVDHRVNARLHMPLTESVAALVNGGFVRHGANIELYDYIGFSASGGVSYSF